MTEWLHTIEIVACNNTGGGGGSGGPTTNPTDPLATNHNDSSVTTPNVEVDNENLVETPCQKLHKLFKDNPMMRNVANQIKGKVENSLEYGYTINSTSGTLNFIPGPNAGSNEVTYKIYENTIGGIHDHPVNTYSSDEDSYPMFDPGDLSILVSLDSIHPTLPDAPIPFTFNMMVVNGFTYVVVPNNPNILGEIEDRYLNNETRNEFNEELAKIYRNINSPYNLNNESGQTQLAREFLKFVNLKYHLNISLYRISNNNFYNLNNTWQELTLNENSPHGVAINNCN